MFTFSCAVQQVEAGDVLLRFEVDPANHEVCRLAVGDTILTFQRNGMLTGITEPAEEEPDDGVSEGHDEPIGVGDKPTAGDVDPPARDAKPVPVSG